MPEGTVWIFSICWVEYVAAETHCHTTTLVRSVSPSSSKSTPMGSEQGPELSQVTIMDSGLKLQKIRDVEWSVEVTKWVATYVWLTAPNIVTGYWDQNAVFLAEEERRNFTYTEQTSGEDGAWQDSVSVRNIWDKIMRLNEIGQWQFIFYIQ